MPVYIAEPERCAPQACPSPSAGVRHRDPDAWSEAGSSALSLRGRINLKLTPKDASASHVASQVKSSVCSAGASARLLRSDLFVQELTSIGKGGEET